MKLNADIGESYGKWILGDDSQIMPMIDQANIACGYHAGDAVTMQDTIRLAKRHKVAIGAHVSYPDIQGFGRRSMRLNHNELVAMIHAQIATLEGMCLCQNISISYVKPHGALYNDMMKEPAIFESVVQAIASYHVPLDLVIQALPDLSKFNETAAKFKIKLRYEAFADRAYTAQGLLVARNKSNALLSERDSLTQVSAMIAGEAFMSEENSPLKLSINTICVHSDTPDALKLCKEIKALLDQHRHCS